MTAVPELDLVISRFLQARRQQVWRAWSEPVHLQAWWCPKPWTSQVRALELEPGGAFHILMRGPDGESSDDPGVFLDVVPQARIVWTSALGPGWRPLDAWLPMTAIVTMEDEGKGTRYTARVLHKDAASRKQHEDLGFFEGWGACIAQLEQVALSLD